ncbi:MAG: hypothetical protein MZW92_44210 [Comamonadaceae bacterium]|nr:hypothetical protein [Comamonadaceae bacterium]
MEAYRAAVRGGRKAEWRIGSRAPQGASERQEADRRKLDGEGSGRRRGGGRAGAGAAAAGAASLVVVGSFGWSPAAARGAPTSGSTTRVWSTTATRFRPRPSTRAARSCPRKAFPLRRTEPAPTPEQRRAREAEDERKRQLAKQQDEAERRDRALLASYTSEREIDLSRRARARDHRGRDRIGHRLRANSLNKRKVAVEQQRAGCRDKPVPIVLERELRGRSTPSSPSSAELIEPEARRSATATAARYDADRVRWRELSGLDRSRRRLHRPRPPHRRRPAARPGRHQVVHALTGAPCRACRPAQRRRAGRARRGRVRCV